MKRVASGWLGSCLSEKGKQLARELGERRLNERIDVVFTSDLARAVETANIAFGGSGVPLHTDERLRECNYGTPNGVPIAQLELERAKHIDEPYPSGESYLDVVKRVEDLLNDLLREWDNKRVVIIGHSATRWALDVLVSGKALSDIVTAPFGWQEGWRYVLRRNH
ncbi:MAG: histidine phosphatase family protein [Chloroflexi bacterium]|nr:histidine phosphatase family protein [Chloroflexota bacterium]